MTSQLVTTFVERGDRGSNRWLEIWVFRDGTLNLVVASESESCSEEHVFACAQYHLRNVLAGAHYQTTGPAGRIDMVRVDEMVEVTFTGTDMLEGWTQNITVEDVDCSLLEAAKMAGTYVA